MKNVKRIVSFLLVFCFIFAFSCGTNEEKTPEKQTTVITEITEDPKPVLPESPVKKTMKELEGSYKVMGRYGSYDTSISTDWSGSGIEFNAYCKGDIIISYTNDHSENKTLTNATYLTVYIDGERQQDRVLADVGTNDVKVASNLPEGEHNIRVYKQAYNGQCITLINSITMTGFMLEKPADRELYIEYIGDSITCGYGTIMGEGDVNYKEYPYTDATQSYAFVCADELGADYSMVARCSWGIITSDYKKNNTLPDIYKYICYSRNRTDMYEFKRTPDAVVFNVGTNDSKVLEEYGKDNYVSRTVDFVKEIRKTYGKDIPVVFVYNMMSDGCSAQIKQIAKNLGGEESGVYTIKMTQNRNGGGNHPSSTAQESCGKKLADLIKTKVLAK